MIIKQLIRPNSADEYGLHLLQNVILNIMTYIDRLCVDNNIEYYIIGGTALGAVRHGGFIPWDDDLDIAMTRDNYNKFISVCRSDKFDTKNYYFQEGTKDWTGYFSKVRLLGTYFDEVGTEGILPPELMGIFVDIFPLDNVPDGKLAQRWWYFCGKLLIAYEQSTHKGYLPNSFAKKIAVGVSKILYIKSIRQSFERQVEKYNNKPTSYIGGHSLVSRFHNTFSKRELWGKATRIPFETISLLAPEDIKGFLTFYFGDYMKLPPEDARRGHHLLNIDYGNLDFEK